MSQGRDGSGTQRQGLGEILVEAGLLTAAQVEEALAVQRNVGERFASILVRQNLLTEKFGVTYLGRQLGLPAVDFSRTTIDLGVLRLVPLALCEEHLVFPIRVERGHLLLAMHDPLDRVLIEQIERGQGVRVAPCVALEVSLKYAIEEARRALQDQRSTITANVQPHLQPVDEPKPGEGADGVMGVKPAEPDAAPVVVDTLLLATADDTSRALWTRTLSGVGRYEVVPSPSGEDVVSRASTADLVIIDAALSGLHGFEACRRIKKADPGRRVLTLSESADAWRTPGDVQEALGSDLHLVKPLRSADLLMHVDRLLGRDSPASGSKDDGDQSLQQGMTALTQGEFDRAGEALQRAIEANPEEELGHYYLGMTSEKLGRPFEAIQHYERAVAVNPQSHDALARLGEICQGLGFRRKAADAWERLLFALPEGPGRDGIKARLLDVLS